MFEFAFLNISYPCFLLKPRSTDLPFQLLPLLCCKQMSSRPSSSCLFLWGYFSYPHFCSVLCGNNLHFPEGIWLLHLPHLYFMPLHIWSPLSFSPFPTWRSSLCSSWPSSNALPSGIFPHQNHSPLQQGRQNRPLHHLGHASRVAFNPPCASVIAFSTCLRATRGQGCIWFRLHFWCWDYAINIAGAK